VTAMRDDDTSRIPTFHVTNGAPMIPTTNPATLIDPSPELVGPGTLFVDASLDEARARHMVHIGQLLYTFWNTGDTTLLGRAVEPSFIDNTLPDGRPQGPAGVAQASAAFREAVPDLSCKLNELIVVADRLAVRLRFHGHFTGTYNGVRGDGQEVDFIAFDIQHVGMDRIIEDWHLEDNLTFLLQAGLVTIAPGDA
jgi:predicted ester cyclase